MRKFWRPTRTDRSWLGGIALAAGCAGDAPPPSDACTGAVFEACIQEHDCDSDLCKNFEQDGFQVCTQACTAGDNTTCPMQNGQPTTCNSMGICKPLMATACRQ